MSENINVRELLGIEPARPHIFIKSVGPDKAEAAKRLAITEQNFEQWFHLINGTNTRQMPEELRELYETTAYDLCRILMAEKEIVTGGAR